MRWLGSGKTVAALSLTVGVLGVAGCGDRRAAPAESSPEGGSSVVESPLAAEIVREAQARFAASAPSSLANTPVIGPSGAVGFGLEGGDLVPELGDSQSALPHPARVTLGADATQPMRIEHASSGLAMGVALVDATATAALRTGGYVVYPQALARGLAARGGVGGDVILRPVAGGVEDYVTIDQPPEPAALGYRIELGSDVRGLRLVSDVLELVDGAGAPWLRMAPPWIIGADGVRHPAEVGLEGCDYDRNPVSPWDRPPVDPGARECVVRISWERDAVRYPALLDPGWTTTGTMASARFHHTASRILTSTGAERVLVTGGWSGTSHLASAELYNPVTATWASAGSMSAARQQHAAANVVEPPVNNGQVLICGGEGASGPIASCELYAPSTGFSSAPSMSTPRAEHTATTLSDGAAGRVLVVGGRSTTSSSSVLDSAVLYDPITNGWTNLPDLATARYGHGAVALGSYGDFVIVAGGLNSSAVALTSVEGVNCGATGACNSPPQPLAPMSQPRARFPIVPVMNAGRAFVTSAGQVGHTEVFNLSSFTWLAAPSSPVPQSGAIASPLATGRVVVTGYDAAILTPTASVFDPVTSQWIPIPGPNPGHAQGAVVRLASGAVLAVGGATPQATAAAHLFTQQANGATCQLAGECASGLCVDERCCNSACTGACQACSAEKKGQGSDGICGAISAGLDPDADCANDGSASCGQNGSCNGSGACELYASGTQCQTSACSSGTLTSYACNGSGTCLLSQSSCAPYLCGSSVTCLTSCTQNSHCVSTHYCSGSACVPKKGLGSTCGVANECASGFCVDGVCCDSACSGLCKACSASKKGPGGGANGECGNVTTGLDPDADCAESASTSCDEDGQCNGAGACRKWAFGTSCGTSQCVGNSATGQICNGNGNCINSTSGQDCAPQLCSAGQCAPCAGDTQCIANHFCDGGTCKPKQADGAACGAGSQCASGFCVDGVCCIVQCSGLCQACSTAKKGAGNDGDCGPIVNGIDPDSECTSAASACGQDGQCNGAGACRLQLAGTPCPTTTCVGNVKTPEVCNGLGTCVTGSGGTNCAPYVCASGQCSDPCVTDAQCIAGSFCDAGACVQKLTNGTSCTTANQCQSGVCADGVCCNSLCSGLCQACTAALKGVGIDGDCGPIKKGNDPQNECAPEGSCGKNGECNGSGACDLTAAGVACGVTQCVGNSSTGQICNGSGACVSDTTGTDCSPYLCKSGACANPCFADADCKQGYFCDSGVCVAKKQNSDTCFAPTECVSGFCADGVCCNALCTSPCMACAAAKKESGLDGECGPAKNGLDPHNDCPDDGAVTCQRDGQCDGAAKCRLYSQGVGCGATSCFGNSVKGKICNGAGACITDNVGTECAPYLCQAGGCSTTCQTDTECLGSHFCNAGLCDPKGNPGDSCSAANACTSGYCVDGVCCDSQCNGQCEACDVEGSEGQCSTISGAPHGSRPACAGTGACKGQCDQTDPTKCTLPGAGTVCAAASCDGDVSQPSGQCDGAGSCALPSTANCLPYGCDATSGACRTECVSDADCAQGAQCDTATGKCAVTGASCKDARTVILPNGQEQSCEPYSCIGGACLDACTTSGDCAPGYRCEAPTCVPTGEAGVDGGATQGAPAEDGGCGCRVGSSPGSGRALGVLGVLVLFALRRRRHALVPGHNDATSEVRSTCRRT